MEKNAAKTAARLKWEAACERLSFVLDPPAGSSADPLDLQEAVGLVHAALENVKTAYDADPPGPAGHSPSKAAALAQKAGGSADDSAAAGARMAAIGGQHRHARTGESITYQVDLHHGPESTYYAARVLLLGDTWHELESGTIAGSDQNARTPLVMQAVFAQIDELDFEALNRG